MVAILALWVLQQTINGVPFTGYVNKPTPTIRQRVRGYASLAFRQHLTISVTHRFL
jgi:hypothetical protein